MKRFIFSILCVAVFFVGLGALVEKTGAKFKSDEKALALIAKSRQAIGGDAAVANVKSLTIVGRTTHSFKVDGTVRSDEGETELALQLPDKMMRSIKIGHDDGKGEAVKTINRQMDVVVTDDKPGQMKVSVGGSGHVEGHGAGTATHVIVKKDGGTVTELTGEEAEKWIAEHGDAGAGAMKIVVKKSDGTVETVNGGDGVKGGMLVRKVDGGNATFKTEDGKTVVLKSTDGGGANVERHVIMHPGDGDTTTFKTEDGNTVFMKKSDGVASGKMIVGDGDHVMFNRVGPGDGHAGMRQNELLRTTLSLLLTAPAGIDVSYTYAGDGDVDGTSCDVVVAEFGGSAYKLYLSKTSSLPVMMSYKGMPEPQVMTFRTKAPDGSGDTKDNVMFTRKVEGGPIAAAADVNVKFSDYRTVGGVQLPYKWTQTSGDASETFDVTTYEINPANIAEKFQGQKVMVRTAKPDGQK